MFGSHLSIAGGMHKALLRTEALGLETVQVFTKNQKTWAVKPLDPAAVDAWAAERDRLKVTRAVSHASYLINLASPDPATREKSVALMSEEVRRCDALGIPYLVVHPGAHLGDGEAAGIGRVAAALDRVHAQLPDSPTLICLESTAGQGTTLGHRLGHLAEIIDASGEPGRLAVCLDTAHLFAAGYDFRGDGFAPFWREVGQTVGHGRVRVLHLNDSKRELGSRVDRHEHIGLGTIGDEGFRPLLREPALREIPKILETPKGDDAAGVPWDTVNVDRLKSLT